MKQHDQLEQLFNFLKTEKINLSDQQCNQLEKYLSDLTLFAVKHRIVSKNDIEHIVLKHFISSFYFVKQISAKISEQDAILDLGSGAGFPGIILSIMLPNRIVLVDSVRKKTLLLNRIVKKLGLNCAVINDRIENFSKNEQRQFKIITARALASINDLIDLAHPFLFNGELHTIKGLDFKNEFSGRENQINVFYHTIDSKWISFSEYLKNKVYISFSAGKR